MSRNRVRSREKAGAMVLIREGIGGWGRGWTAIQIREGDNLSCKLARIVDNTIVSLSRPDLLVVRRVYIEWRS